MKNRYFSRLGYDEKLPRKFKKYIFGDIKGKSQIRKMLKEMRIEGDHTTIYDGFGLNKEAFCLNCGCTLIDWSGNRVSYPELWESGRCMRCGHKVAEADNSPYYHEIYNLLKYGDAAFYGGDDFTYYIPRKSSLHKFIPKSEY